eukprot:TRINITY_DN36173_c0_g1_i1.p1 TRINITY_DN36173_c0_g1~~TRINITY_DN36173_c0_g1_i1.p1  ORF type:complete len:730 (-),score=111.28 TRINITY_DN36173_c0_g1_i1:211-2400(-)
MAAATLGDLLLCPTGVSRLRRLLGNVASPSTQLAASVGDRGRVGSGCGADDSGNSGSALGSDAQKVARAAVSAVDDFEASSVAARRCLESPPWDMRVLESLEALLSAWTALNRAAQMLEDSAVDFAHLAADVAGEVGGAVDSVKYKARRREVQALADALLDQAIDAKADLRRNSAGDPAVAEAFDKRLRLLCTAGGWGRTVLSNLGVDTSLAELDAEKEPSNMRAMEAPAVSAGNAYGSEARRGSKAVRFSLPGESQPASNANDLGGVAVTGNTTQAGKPSDNIGLVSEATTRGGPKIHEIWRAVQAGDVAVLKQFAKDGVVVASTVDAAGHSVLWHLIAWGHLGLALFFTKQFPFGTAGGADVAERHKTRGDTLLHLISRVSAFGTEAAELFSCVIKAADIGRLFPSRNLSGETFLDVAAARLNFWVLQFLLKHFPEQAVKVVRGPPAELACVVEPPLRGLARRIAKPQCPEPPTSKRWPQHIDLSHMLAADPTTGMASFADVAFEVALRADGHIGQSQGKDGNGGGGEGGGVSRCALLAHRVVVGSRSPVLFEEFSRLKLEPFPGKPGVLVAILRVDPRISKDVWKGVLCFLYSGDVHSALLGREPELWWLIELLRACTLYKLPQPLLDHTHAKMSPLLPAARPEDIFEIFSLVAPQPPRSPCGGEVATPVVAAAPELRLRATREASAYWLLRNAAKLGKLDPATLAKTLIQALRTLEDAVFRHRAS